MEQIAVYFKKFEGLGASERETKKILLDAISSVLGQDVSDVIGFDKIEINKDKIRLKITGPIKNEISMHKNKIEKIFLERVVNKKGISKEARII